MRTTGFLLLLALFVAALAAGCSNKETGNVKVTPIDAESAAAGKGPGGIIIRDEEVSSLQESEGEVTVERLAARVKQERHIIAKPGETIRLYYEWSGIPVDELKLINDDKLPTFGRKYVLSLTASEFADFEQKRQDYWTEKKKEMYDKNDVKAIEYVVKKNDTLDGIARKFDVPLWFIVMHNEACDPYRLSPGTKMVIPKLEAKKVKAEAAADGGQISEQDSKEVFPVLVKRGETVGLYAKWGQVSVQDIKRANRNVQSFDKIRIGDTLNLPLTAKQFKRFQELRKEFQEALEAQDAKAAEAKKESKN
jgi:LysM repeat protein